jgi:kinase suppressor of Ras 2
MIDINAKHLEGLRTECAITAELTQNEIRTLEVLLYFNLISISILNH